jgi:hypothetical protein
MEWFFTIFFIVDLIANMLSSWYLPLTPSTLSSWYLPLTPSTLSSWYLPLTPSTLGAAEYPGVPSQRTPATAQAISTLPSIPSDSRQSTGDRREQAQALWRRPADAASSAVGGIPTP